MIFSREARRFAFQGTAQPQSHPVGHGEVHQVLADDLTYVFTGCGKKDPSGFRQRHQLAQEPPDESSNKRGQPVTSGKATLMRWSTNSLGSTRAMFSQSNLRLQAGLFVVANADIGQKQKFSAPFKIALEERTIIAPEGLNQIGLPVGGLAGPQTFAKALYCRASEFCVCRAHFLEAGNFPADFREHLEIAAAYSLAGPLQSHSGMHWAPYHGLNLRNRLAGPELLQGYGDLILRCADCGHRREARLYSPAEALQAQVIKVEALDLSELRAYGQAQNIADATGRHCYSRIDISQIVNEIKNAITAVFAAYTTVTFSTAEVPTGVSVNIPPPAYRGEYDRTIDRTFTFQVTFTANRPGNYNFHLPVLVD
jgi:hypothetical protein